MSTSTRNGNGALVRMVWYRRIHRWLGIAGLVFLLLLATTGIALNHVSDWRLDERHIGWSWLLHVYGIEVPSPSASFAEDRHRATLIGRRLYLDGKELARDIETLAGIAVAEEVMVVATADEFFMFTAQGELIERLEADEAVTMPLQAVGVASGRVIVRSGDELLRFDDALLRLHPWTATDRDDLHWSTQSPVPADDLEELVQLYRGQGITLARLLADLHSGRILTRAGPLLMDAAGVVLFVLCLTGLFMWLPKGPNGGKSGKGSKDAKGDYKNRPPRRRHPDVHNEGE